MTEPNTTVAKPSAQAEVLLAILANQVARTEACLEGLTDAELDTPTGGDCHTVRGILQHLLELRGFQLFLMQSPLQANLPKADVSATLQAYAQALAAAADLVREAIVAHDPADWFAAPATPRPGPWGTDATLIRLARPINDFTNHLGAIRAIRRMRGNPAPRTQ